QALARLDTTQLEAQLAVQSANLAAASAQVLSAQTTLEEAKDTLDTQSSLYDRGLVIHSVYEAADAAWKRADAAYLVADANLDLAQANYDAQSAELDKAVILSPIDGVVLDVAAEPGQIVAASLSAPTLFTIAEDLSKMQLLASVAEADIGQVSEGDNATFTVEAYDGVVFPASIAQVRYASTEEDGLVSYTAVLAVENPDTKLLPGMTAVADITVAEATGVLTVPNAALRYVHSTPTAAAATDDTTEETGSGRNSGFLGMIMPGPPGQDATPSARADGSSIWVLRDGQPVRIEVTTGATDGSRTEVAGEGLAEGDQVITAALSTQ
ncbi:MAG: efflux RND transporter periplasmic adaptor subunit, partial [Maritimibacter sp.]|nr:efflux RND transporter periplasmic adaptor subunit [Maritimibacter sp.]